MSTTRTDLRAVNASVAGEIEACGLELLFDRAVEQEGQCGDEDMSLHAIVGAMIDRSHVEDRL